MALYTTYQIKFSVALESGEKNFCFKRTDETTNKVVRTDLTVEESGNLLLAANTADYSLPMGKVATGKILFVEADQEITIKLEGEATGHKIKPVSSTYKARLLLEGEFTVAPSVSCGTAGATVSYCIVGASA